MALTTTSQETDLSKYNIFEQAKNTLNGSVLHIVNRLSRMNQLFKYLDVVEANDRFSHVYSFGVSDPAGSYRKFNGGVAYEEPVTDNGREQIAMLESFSFADCALIDGSADPAQERMNRANRFLDGMGRTMATKFITGAISSGDEFDGFQARRTSLGTYCLGCGGSGGDTTSAYLVEIGQDGVYGVYPKGSKSIGIEHVALPKDVVLDGSGNPYMAYRDHFKVHFGLVVADPRALIRITNIESSTVGGSNEITVAKIIQARNILPTGNNAYLLVNRNVKAQIDNLAAAKSNVWWTGKDAFGKPVTMFQDIPVLMMEAIGNTETAVS